MTIFADVCKKSNVEISKMEVTAEADKPADSPKLTGVNMKVTVACKREDRNLTLSGEEPKKTALLYLSSKTTYP